MNIVCRILDQPAQPIDHCSRTQQGGLLGPYVRFKLASIRSTSNASRELHIAHCPAFHVQCATIVDMRPH